MGSRAAALAGVLLVAAILGATGDAATVRSPRFGAALQVGAVETRAYLQEIGVADVTGDGNADAVITRFWPDSAERAPITILVGNGKSGFSDRTADLFSGAVPATSWARRTAFADFNRDGRADVFIAETGLDRDPFAGAPSALILSAPNGKLVDASANLPQAPAFTHSVAIADLNGDGAPDIFEGNLSGPTVMRTYEVLLNDGSGRFRVADSALPADLATRFSQHWDGCGAADVNGDRAVDLILLGSSSTPSRVLLNDGVAHFHDLAGALPPKPWGLSANGLAVTPADLNGDGHVDLLAAFTKQDPFYVGRWVQVLIGNGDGTFRDETATRLPQVDNTLRWPYSIYVADLNGDKRPDIAVTAFSGPGSTPSFYLNKGDGTFVPLPLSVFATAPAPMLGLLDANRDGRLDVLDASPSAFQGGRERYSLHRQLAPPKAKPKCKRTKRKRCKKLSRSS